MIFIPVIGSDREFLLPVKAGYDILEPVIPSSKNFVFYYFLTTFGCRVLPRFAAFCRDLPSRDFHFGIYDQI